MAEDPDENKLVSRLLSYYQAADDYKKKWTGPWEMVFRFVMADQYGDMPEWRAAPVHNYVGSKLNYLTSALTNNRPKIHILPRDPAFAPYAEARQKSIDQKWQRLRMDTVLKMVTKNACMYSKGFYYVYWDVDENEIQVVSVDPQNIWADPFATTTDDARYIIHKAVLPLAEAEMKWPGCVGKVQAGTWTVEDGTFDFKDRYTGEGTGDAIPHYVRYLNDDNTMGGVAPSITSADGHDPDDEMIQVLQFWIRDPTKEEVPSAVEPDKIYCRPKYPGGRLIVICGNRIIHDQPNPYLHGKFPYVDQSYFQMPGEFWGKGPLQDLLSPQMEYNKTLGAIMDIRNLMGNPQWLVPTVCQVKKKLTGEAGLIINYQFGPNGEKPEKVPGSDVPASTIHLLDHLIQQIDTLSGSPDVTQGRKPTGIQAGVAIESLMEAANVLHSDPVGNLETAITRVGEQMLALEQQYYTAPKAVRIFDPMTGAFAFQVLTPEMIAGQWDVEVATGSTLPRSREARQNEAIAYFQAGLIGPRAALNHTEFDDKEGALMELGQMQSMAAQAAGAPGEGDGGESEEGE
jgi:hypothetical protein